MRKQIALAILATALLSSATFAFDGKKEGFMMSAGVGVGLSSTDFTAIYDGWSRGRANTELGVATSFKIGYGINETYTLYLFRNSAFVDGYSKDPNKETYGNCVTGVGMNYYIPHSNFYTIAGFGRGQLSKFKESEHKASKGYGGIIGLGYAFTDTIQIEANYLATRVDDDGIKLSTDAVQLTLNYYFN